MEKEKLADIVSLFNIEGTVCEIKPLGEGLINDTFRVITAEEDKPNYVLQRVNHVVFPDVDMVMRNIRVTLTPIVGAWSILLVMRVRHQTTSVMRLLRKFTIV